MAVTDPGPARTALSLGACAVVAGAMVYFITRGGEAPVAGVPEAVEAAAPVPPAVVPAPVPQTAAAAPVPGTVAPSVDVLRVEPGGSTVVAGTAAARSVVSVLAGDRKLAEVRADEAGNFVAIFEAGGSAVPRALTIESEAGDGTRTRSEQVMLLLPEAKPEAAVTVAEVLGAEVRGAEVPVAEMPAEEATAEAATAVGATAILTPEAAEVTPVARPTGAAANRVSLSSIAYGEAGDVTLAGFGREGATLRAYVDGTLAREGRVGPEGRWTLGLEDLAAGTYRLRIDEIDAGGAVASRVETPFRRVVDAGPSAPGRVAVVVQPGNNLWTLARVHYGSGPRYTQIFDANAALISDPDLIYPGQIFNLPESDTE